MTQGVLGQCAIAGESEASSLWPEAGDREGTNSDRPY